MFPCLQFSFVRGGWNTSVFSLATVTVLFFRGGFPLPNPHLLAQPKIFHFKPFTFALKFSGLSKTILQVSKAYAKCFLTLMWTFALRYHFKRKIPHKRLRNKSPAGDSEPLMKCTASSKKPQILPHTFLRWRVSSPSFYFLNSQTRVVTL